MSRPPLDLHAVVTDPDGTAAAWRSDSPLARDVPAGIRFSTRRGDGFADASVQLPRRIDRDWPDLGLLDSIEIVGAQGDIAYEGRIAAAPRTVSDGHAIDVQAAGWMTHARQRRAQEVFIDRDLQHWEQPPRPRRAQLLAGTPIFPLTGTVQVGQDATSRLPALVLEHTQLAPGGTPTRRPLAEAWYDGQGARLGKVVYDVATKDVSTGAALTSDFSVNLFLARDELAAQGAGTASLHLGATGTLAVPDSRYAVALLYYVGAFTGAGTWTAYMRNLAVVGDHGLELIGDAPGGVRASDVIRYVAGKYCPRLRLDEVQDTSYPITHLEFRDAAFPFDIFQSVNRFHRWDLGVFEDRQLRFAPVDLTDYDWEIRLGDPGTTTTLQGDSTQQLANGIEVEFYDIGTGRRRRLGPDEHPELRDHSVEHPANRHGEQLWTTLALSSPTDEAGAVQIGRMALAEFNQPKGAGQITVAGGYVRDCRGQLQPAWKVRCGDRIAITDSASLSDRPRLVGETTYTHPGRLELAVDSTLPRVEALLDRFATALQAANLSA
jgi:hypothetical protein